MILRQRKKLRFIHGLFRFTRENYGDAAIGYVELERETSKCVVKGQVCPEHTVRARFDATLHMTSAAVFLSA
jgi:D-lyxose ketol-isomerase